MLPHWVQTLDDYWTWVETLLDSTGGWLDATYLQVELLVEDETVPYPRPLVLEVDRQRLRFVDGSYLSFEFSVDAQFSALGYSFHYARADDRLVWRYDKHLGHEAEDGQDTHVHLGAEDVRQPHPEVDLGDVVERIAADQEQRSA